MASDVELDVAPSAPGATPYAIPPREDLRSRGRRILGPVLTAAGSLAALGYLAAVDPNQPGHYPLCPTQAIFSVDCPGCGLMRGTHDLITGDAPRALDHNVLVIVLLPLAVVLWARWAMHAWRGRYPGVTHRAMRRRTVVMVSATAALVVFGVVRNLVPYLGSGIG